MACLIAELQLQLQLPWQLLMLIIMFLLKLQAGLAYCNFVSILCQVSIADIAHRAGIGITAANCR